MKIPAVLADWRPQPDDEAIARRNAEERRRSHHAALVRELEGVKARQAQWERRAAVLAAEAAEAEPHWRTLIESERDAALRRVDDYAGRCALIAAQIKETR